MSEYPAATQLRLYDTATRAVGPFVPLEANQVGIYLCGATVQSPPHVGHLRPVIAFDVLRRWLERSGYAVTMIRNITDIDDKILGKAAASGERWWAHAFAVEQQFAAAYRAVNVPPPTYEPRATAHIPDMVALIGRLNARGHAYVTTPGNIWFDVSSWPAYGELTRQRLEELDSLPATCATTGSLVEKRSAHDFALWKAPKPGEPATAAWPTPWGAGRPGWHLECSAMAQRYLGDTFDIHGGGLDLRFPHHENEQAQSRAAGSPFAQRWMHSAWITQSGAKMSKSLGNGLLVTELLAKAQPAAVRYAIASVQYRSMLEWTKDTLTEVGHTWERIRGCVMRATERLGPLAPSRAEVLTCDLPPAFSAAMNDDLNAPAALAVVHEHLKRSNAALACNAPAEGLRAELAAVRAMLDVLGLDPLDEHWGVREPGGVAERHALESLVAAEICAREAARANKDWATSDAIRDRLAAAGVSIEDTAAGARWTLSK